MTIVDATATELYGTDLRISDDGDLVVSPSGDLVLVTGGDNAAQALRNRLRTPPNELPMHPTYGSTLLTRTIGAKMGDPQLILAQVNTETTKLIREDRRFVAVRDVSVTSDPARNAVEIPMALVLAGGDVLNVANLATGRADEMAMDLADLADLADLGAYPAIVDLVEGIDPDDPDYGDDVPDFAQLLDEADVLDADAPESEGP